MVHSTPSIQFPPSCMKMPGPKLSRGRPVVLMEKFFAAHFFQDCMSRVSVAYLGTLAEVSSRKAYSSDLCFRDTHHLYRRLAPWYVKVNCTIAC